MIAYLAHATSFCRGVWAPVVNALEGRHTVAWDFAGHGSGPSLERPVSWATFGRQVLDETERGGVGVGHSMGAAALVMAELADPGRFSALVLVEPILFPGPHGRQEHRLAEIAEKRKASYPSREAARANFAGREPFRRWHPGAFEGYLDCGLVGEGPVRLACDPEVEADIYRASNDHETWERLGEVAAPTLILAGAQSDTISSHLAREQARLLRGGVEIVPDTGHFLPMEEPGLVARRVARLLDQA